MKKTITYFETDKIQTVTLTMESEVSMKWYEATPSKPIKFLGIRVGTYPGKKAGWAYSINHERNSTDELLVEWKGYRVDEEEMKVYNKAHVSIHFSYKHTLGTRFDTNEDAQQYVDELIEQSGRSFNVIIN
jgi:hypothetical protein